MFKISLGQTSTPPPPPSPLLSPSSTHVYFVTRETWTHSLKHARARTHTQVPNQLIYCWGWRSTYLLEYNLNYLMVRNWCVYENFNYVAFLSCWQKREHLAFGFIPKNIKCQFPHIDTHCIKKKLFCIFFQPNI